MAFSAVEICRKAGNKRQFQEIPRWAVPPVLRLLDRGLIEDDGLGHYQMAQHD